MLNLVQLQERLKDVPMKALMEYANGMNRDVPPFIALGELNRRKQMQESAAAEQAKQMEGAPTIKEQVEQQAGLLALQGARQRSAGRQAAAQQAAMAMPATNNMQSEPVQLASGGMIDEVSPRDYMGGGLARLPIRRDMFERQAYAGGGIVAFENGGSVFNRVDTSNTMRKKSSQYLDLLKSLFGGGDEEVDPSDPTAMMGTRPSAGARNLAEVKDERGDTSKDDAMRRDAARQQQIFRDILSGARPVPKRSDDAVLMAERRPPGMPPKKEEGQGLEAFPASVVARDQGEATGIDSLMRPRLSLEQQLEEVRRINKLAGRDPNLMGDYEKRIGDIEARRIKDREGDAMDQITSFLSGIAGSRRGAKFGEAGAAGVAASSKLAAEQKAIRDRQEMDMAQLRLSIAKEKDALARGDVDAARAERDKQDKLNFDLMKLKEESDYRREDMKLKRERFAFDRSQADELRQVESVRKYLADFRAKNANNPKYITNPELLEIDAMNAARQFYGADKLAQLGLGAGAPSPAATGKRPPLSSFQG